jgi:hypothetical protein
MICPNTGQSRGVPAYRRGCFDSCESPFNNSGVSDAPVLCDPEDKEDKIFLKKVLDISQEEVAR